MWSVFTVFSCFLSFFVFSFFLKTKTTCGVLLFGLWCLQKGSNVKKIGTVATYDALSREFVIVTPNSAAQKFCIVNGTLATHAVVFAQLIVSEQNVYMTYPHIESFSNLSTLYTLHSTLYTLHSTHHSTLYTHTTHHTIHSTLCSTLYTLYYMLYTLSTLYTQNVYDIPTR